MHSGAESARLERRHFEIAGTTQGIGFRPFVFRLAQELQLSGWVKNVSIGVEIEVQGAPADLTRFEQRVRRESAAHSAAEIHVSSADVTSDKGGFVILPSSQSEISRLTVPPDLALCTACRQELFNPGNRRYRYPFISCTDCGPRYSITRGLPFDRERTSMQGFPLCATCRAEYEDSSDRRLHAQTIACAQCGPRVSFRTDRGEFSAEGEDALSAAVESLQRGEVLAVQGIGGFHLLTDAASDAAVDRLRRRKGRDGKPLALMFESAVQVSEYCLVSAREAELLESAAAPIVLLPRRKTTGRPIAASVAPDSPLLGCLLAYSPLHALLLHDFGGPLVATSGNRSEEAICSSPREAVERLTGIADAFLVHDRAIEQPCDDSVLRVICDTPVLLRRARGYAPQPLRRSASGPVASAVGGQQKNCVAIACGNEFALGPHVGDLDSPSTAAAHERSLRQWSAWYQHEPVVIACDLHPDYYSTRRAAELGPATMPVQHHYAHALACMLEHNLQGEVLAVVWDGAGMGTDGTIWGGEFLIIDDGGFERWGSLRPFPLFGGDLVAREPRRAALGLLYAAGGEALWSQVSDRWKSGFSAGELKVLAATAKQLRGAMMTTSVGRLFDAFAALLGLRQRSAFEAQAALELEYAAQRSDASDALEFKLDTDRQMDWRSALFAALEQLRAGRSRDDVARALHLGLADGIVQVAQMTGLPRVILTGGCFQNAVLVESAVRRLRAAGFQVFFPSEFPPNDGGLALGQLAAARRHYQGDWTCAWRSRAR